MVPVLLLQRKIERKVTGGIKRSHIKGRGLNRISSLKNKRCDSSHRKGLVCQLDHSSDPNQLKVNPKLIFTHLNATSLSEGKGDPLVRKR